VGPGSLGARGVRRHLRPLVMGVLNVTPDSFSDGGLYAAYDAAVAHGHALLAQGADVVDVGGESSRPGAEPVALASELDRVVPVVEALATPAAARGARISVDTAKPEVARAAVAAGAGLLNDITASLWEVAAETGAGWVAMHMQGEPRTMQREPHYDDVVAEVRDFVLARARRALAAGVAEVWVDPGIGFGKTTAHNLTLLRHLPELVAEAATLGCAGVAVGTSRKRFLGVLAATAGRGETGGAGPAGPGEGAVAPLPTSEREEGSLATMAAALVAGAGMVRVHEVAAAVGVARLYGPAA
jgi:dihydropteroate synthase